MSSQVGKKSPKLWLIVLVVFLILGCCFLALFVTSMIYVRSEGIDLKDLVSNLFQNEPQILATESIDQGVAEEDNLPVYEETLVPMLMEDSLLAITPSGIWQVNEDSREIFQISYDSLDAPRRFREGLSPNKRYYAYITGDLNPTLVVLDLQTKDRAFETPLSGPNIQIGPGMDASDPGQSVLLAMQSSGSLAWSPDSAYLAFIGAMDNSSTDLYLLQAADFSINRLSEEASNTAHINWSPDGRFIEFVTVNNFGTGAGMDMDAIWVYDRSLGIVNLLEQSASSGEEFVAWINNESFYMHSWSAICSSYNLRSINAFTGVQDTILGSCFSGVAYEPVGKMGIVAVGDLFIDACQCGEVTDYGTYSFGESLGMNEAGIKIKKFEYINAYNVELLDPGNLFAIYTDEGLTHLFDTTGFPITIPDAVSGLEPYPSPIDGYWAWYPYYGENTGLWLTDDQMNLYELSADSSGNVIWSRDGERLYFYEMNRIFYADAPGFTPMLFAEIPESQILGIGN